ncbi:MAG TPA: serine hydrolase, partial [Minicystis sp.]|nr:serine hydrolase [Minicystis sp.]
MPTRRGVAGVLWTLATLLLSILCTSCTVVRVLYYNVPNRNAPSWFDARRVEASARPVKFARAAAPVDFAIRRSKTRSYATFDALLAENHTTAMVVLDHGVVVYERYFDGVTAATRLPCFSMSKTFAAATIGCAEQDGLLSTDAKLVSYVPALAEKRGYDAITLEQLLRMTSGIDFVEESVAGAMLYYTEDLRAQAHAYDVKWPAGTHYEYASVDIQLLGEVLARKLGDETVSRYFQRRLWGPMGAEHAATWSLDSREHGVEKFSSGLNATARDYARLGVVFQHGGRFGERRIVSERWVEESLAYDDVAGVVHTTDGAVRRGRHQWFWTLDGCCYF